MKYTEVETILNNNKNEIYHIIKFDDEDTISVNLITDGKISGHMEFGLRCGLLKALTLEKNETIHDSKGNTVKCINKIVGTL